MNEAITPSDWNCQATPLSPFGLRLDFDPAAGRTFAELSAPALARLLRTHRLIALQGLAPSDDKGAFAADCRRFGPLLEWNFGVVFEVVEHADPYNYLFTSGSVPYHWDGAFADQVPWLQCFRCQESPGQDAGGETLFCDTTAVWNAASEETRRRWSSLRFEYATEKVAHYGGSLTAPLMSSHPLTAETTLRFAEPANRDTASLNTPTVRAEGTSPAETDAIVEELRSVLYDERFAYAHGWTPGEVVLADNHALLHGRTRYRPGLPRRLWRTHVLSPAETPR